VPGFRQHRTQRLRLDEAGGHISQKATAADKTTTMRMIAGLDRPTSGTVRVNGKHYPGAAAPMAELGILLDARSVHPGLSARNNLLALARTAGIGRRRVDEVIELAGLALVGARAAAPPLRPVRHPRGRRAEPGGRHRTRNGSRQLMW
jgi:ABC-type taurine transport system ATPase subunit